MNKGGEKHDSRIGEILMEAGLVNREQLAAALDRQKREGGRVCSHLITLGYLQADELLEFLGGQVGVAAVNLGRYRIPSRVLDLVPAPVARRHRVIPVHLLDEVLTVAMEDPRDPDTVKELEALSGCRIEPLICPQALLEQALDSYYPEGGAVPLRRERRVLSLDAEGEGSTAADQQTSREARSGLEWMKRVIFAAIKKRSREIHLEPREEGTQVRFRVGSSLVNGEVIPDRAGLSLPGVLHDMSGEGTGSTGQPGEGWIRIRARNRELKVVFSTFPVIHGERVVMRLVDEGFLKRPLSEQGLSPQREAELQTALRGQRRLFLVTSPVASQGQWTMYQLMDMVKNDALNLITVEPYVLFPLPGVNQTLYGEQTGSLQGAVLEAALRQEPDLLAVAGLDDYTVLEDLLVAASRCLVIGTTPLTSSLDTLGWLMRSPHSPLGLAHLLGGIISVRLVPRLCPSCRRHLAADIRVLEGTREHSPEEMRFFESPGCRRCEGSGRSGSEGLFEVFIPDGDLREMMAAGAPPRTIYEEAQRRGMRTLLEEGLLKATEGRVDVRDVLRVAPTELP